MEPSLRRRLFFGVVVAALVLLVIEVGCQLAYRLTVGDFLFRRLGAPIFEADPTRCYRLKPKLAYRHRTNEFDITLYTDSHGMRTDAERRDVTPEKPPGVYRILFLGPSFALGWGSQFEESYATRVGEMLRGTGRSVEILNLGTPAQGVAPQLCWLEKVGRRYQPDMVVQTLYGDRIPTVAGECPEPLACPVVESGWLYSVKPTLRRRLIGYLKHSAVVFYAFYAYQWALGVSPSGEVGTGKELHEPRSVQRSYDDMARDFARYERTIRGILGERAQVVFLFIPLSYVVDPGDAPRWSHLVDADPIATREGIRADVDALRARQHVVVDASETLIERADEERLYYWLDIHLTPAGNRVVAEALFPALRERIEPTRP
ncbi:MAG: hypothetical protein ACREI8_08315 [Myxococcota bacterium]